MCTGYHKSYVYVFQIRSNEAMDEKERLSLRSQSRTTSRQTSPRMGARKSMFTHMYMFREKAHLAPAIYWRTGTM